MYIYKACSENIQKIEGFNELIPSYNLVSIVKLFLVVVRSDNEDLTSY